METINHIDLIVGEELGFSEIVEIFGESNLSLYGNAVIGENMLIARDPEFENSVWTFLLISISVEGMCFRLIYKYT